MNWGLTLTGDQVTLEETVAVARRAEEANFDSIWVTELWRDAFVPLTAMAMATERIRLGSAVALTMARSPVLMELAAAGVDELSKGRLVLGIGAGPRAFNESWHSVPLELCRVFFPGCSASRRGGLAMDLTQLTKFVS